MQEIAKYSQLVVTVVKELADCDFYSGVPYHITESGQIRSHVVSILEKGILYLFPKCNNIALF